MEATPKYHTKGKPMPTPCKPVPLDQQILTTRELSDLLDVSTTTIHTLTNRRVLESITPIARGSQDGGRYRLGPAVRAFLLWEMRGVDLSEQQEMKAALMLAVARDKEEGAGK
jgi:hypothetical protein